MTISNGLKDFLRPWLRKIPAINRLYARTEAEGMFPAGHFHSAVPAKDEALRYLSKHPPPDPQLADVDLNLVGQTEHLHAFQAYYADLPFPHAHTVACRYYYEQAWFGQADAIYLYSFLRHYKPRKIIEVGSGFSSAVMLDTRANFLGPDTHFTFIEPNTERLDSVLTADDHAQCTVLREPVQEVSVKRFRELSKGDLLFIDSSHVMKCGSDLHYLMFSVLPVLQAGVIVHFHDVFYPFEYPEAWIDEGRYWNECYALHALLSGSHDWEILLFGDYLAKFHQPLINEYLPLALENTGGSLYIRRKSRKPENG